MRPIPQNDYRKLSRNKILYARKSAFKYSLYGNIIDIWKIARLTKSFIDIDTCINAFVSTFVCLFLKELSKLVKSSIHRLYI